MNSTTINQSYLYRFERLVSKMVKPSEPPAICIIPHGGNLKLCAFGKEAILTMLIHNEGFVDPFTLHWADLKQIAVKKDVGVTFHVNKDAVHVRYGEQQHWFPTNKKVNSLPTNPPETATFEKTQLLDALNQAARCTDPANIKYALGAVCFRGSTSQIISTSGTQLLVQDGFLFPWKDDVLCPVSKLFASKELKEIDTDEMLLGYTPSNWVYAGVGEVEIWLRGIEGKFPKVEGLMKPAEDTTWLEIAPTDAAFILDRLETLPGKKDKESPVWFALDEKVLLRAYDLSEKSGITLELTQSKFTGKHAKCSMNRLFLKNALQFGCLRQGFDPNGENPPICTGGDHTFIYVPLTGAEPEYDPERMTVIASSAQSAAVPKKVDAAPALVKRRRKVVAKRQPAKQTESKVALLQSAEDVRQTLRQSLTQINTLIREVKAQRRQDRLLRTTMDSLNKLKLTIA